MGCLFIGPLQGTAPLCFAAEVRSVPSFPMSWHVFLFPQWWLSTGPSFCNIINKQMSKLAFSLAALSPGFIKFHPQGLWCSLTGENFLASNARLPI